MSRKLALLIGNSTYGPDLPPLEKPDADIAALAKVLADPAIGGFDIVKPLLDETSATARREVARFFSGRSPDDLLLLYFSGHGLRNNNGDLYLAVQDTEADLLSGTAVPATFISEEMDNCRSRRQILILDCCYSGAFERGAKGPAANPAIAFTGNGLGRVVLTASDSTQLAWEEVAATSTGGLSVFTRHLVGGLESGEADLDGDGLISVDELYDYVYARVVEENPRQTPGKSTSKQKGDIILARNRAGPRRRPELPAELRQALDRHLAAAGEGAIHELTRFLRGSDERLAEAVRAAAEQARGDDSRSVALGAGGMLAAIAPERAEPVPLSKPGPKLQPAQAPKSHEERHSALRRATWIALGLATLTVTVALLVSRTNEHSDLDAREEKHASFTGTPTTLDPNLALLTEAKSWPLILADNFDSAEASTSFPLRGPGAADKLATYTGIVSSGVLRLTGTAMTPKGSFFHFPARRTSLTTDFYLSVKVKQSVGPEKADAGPIFLSKDGERWCAFLINDKNYRFGIYSTATYRWRSLRQWTASSAIHPRQTNSLAILGKGSDLILFINDQKVDQITDATLSFGLAGLGVETYGLDPVAFDFDNFELHRRPSVFKSPDGLPASN